MNQNNVLCDLYIGKGAGKKILTEIDDAQQSVKIISPYLSPTLIYKLVQLHKRGISIELVTTDAIMENTENYVGTFKQLISQKKVYNKAAENLKNVLSWTARLVWLALLVIVLLLFGLKDSLKDQFILYVIGAILCIVIGSFLQIKLSKLKVFKFHYDSIFPIKFLIAPENAHFPIKTFIHSKVYIIDNQIMYWGSLNFTSMGLHDNYETRIRTTDIESIAKMNKEFEALMHSNKLPERSLSSWGHQIYNSDIQIA